MIIYDLRSFSIRLYSYVPVVLSSEAFISQRLSSADSVSLLAPPATLLCRELLQNQSADSFSASATFDSPLQVPSSDSFCRLVPAGSCRLSPAGSFVRFFLQILSSCLFASASSEKQARGRAIHLCRRFFLQIASGSQASGSLQQLSQRQLTAFGSVVRQPPLQTILSAESQRQPTAFGYGNLYFGRSEPLCWTRRLQQ